MSGRVVAQMDSDSSDEDADDSEGAPAYPAPALLGPVPRAGTADNPWPVSDSDDSGPDMVVVDPDPREAYVGRGKASGMWVDRATNEGGDETYLGHVNPQNRFGPAFRPNVGGDAFPAAGQLKRLAEETLLADFTEHELKGRRRIGLELLAELLHSSSEEPAWEHLVAWGLRNHLDDFAHLDARAAPGDHRPSRRKIPISQFSAGGPANVLSLPPNVSAAQLEPIPIDWRDIQKQQWFAHYEMLRYAGKVTVQCTRCNTRTLLCTNPDCATTKHAGLGLVALQQLPVNSLRLVYWGQVYEGADGKAAKGDYIMQGPDPSHAVAFDATPIECLAKRVNDSQKSDVNVRPWPGFRNMPFHVYVNHKPVSKGGTLLINYGPGYVRPWEADALVV
jgi:hypothetical protein